jgi:hypothetical protein
MEQNSGKPGQSTIPEFRSSQIRKLVTSVVRVVDGGDHEQENSGRNRGQEEIGDRERFRWDQARLWWGIRRSGGGVVKDRVCIPECIMAY